MTSVNALEVKQENGKILLNTIESFDFTKAVEFLQQGHSFSKNALYEALLSACRHGHELLVQTLVNSGASVHRKDKFGNTPLMICTQKGFADIVRFLIEKKVDVNAKNSDGDTALLLSIGLSRSSEITKLLLEHPRIQFDHQNIALKKAVWVRNAEAVNMLLDIKVKKNEKLMKPINHVQKAAKSIAGNVVGSAVQHVKPHKIPKKTSKGSTGKLQVKTAMPTSSARPAGATLESELDEIFKYMFQKCNFNTTNIFSIIKKLLECGADVNTSWLPLSYVKYQSELFEIDGSCEIRDLNKLIKAPGNLKATPLQCAAEIGHYELVKLLLKYQAKVNEDNFLQSALHWALLSGHTDCAKLLLQHGAKMHVIYALVAAVKFQIPSYMKFLCENYQDEIVNILQKFNNLNAFVRAAVRGSNLQILTQILEVGADCSNVHFPLAESRNCDITRFLIEKGVDVNAPKQGSHWNKTPLLEVIRSREYTFATMKLIQVLLENGASVNDRDCKQRTPLIIAACSDGSISLLQLLLDHGADISSKDHKGNNALICAIQADSTCSPFLIKFAKNRKDVLNAQNNEGLTAVMAAAAVEGADLIRKLLRHGADVHIKDNHGNTALFHYLSSDCESDAEPLQMLVSAGSDVNWHNKDGLSPLMVAAKKCLPWTITNVLFNSGADVNAVCEKDKTKTALSFVPIKSSLQESVVYFIDNLLDKGADASYVNPRYLPELILSVHEDYIPNLIRHGLGPSDIQLHDPRKSGIHVLSTASPLCLALLVGNVPLAQYFVDNLYFTKSDVSSLMSNNDLRDLLRCKHQQDCLDFLDTMNLQPWSLFNLALVAISSAVGPSHGRESRVNTLPLPEKMKHKLLYRTADVELIITRDRDTISQIQFRGLQIRKFKNYYTHALFPLYVPNDMDYGAALSTMDDHHSDDNFDYDSDSNSLICSDLVNDCDGWDSDLYYSYPSDSDIE